eukprot:CAMPEP_0202866146 /NCGR_PEP_ID=MMETSP1391-20130828/7228_1 /ASSEMBLY_ACC=CAM_ASM_000867 /TAXON_ID=1034604 /ORGANISM="Chlamydomonas leiostraca, Strain SAG 11-49" /LENGTH=91 /DNA_ID=CAMNT_0049546069 /DNA_START=2830 /DNA_END=3105 /DNA_ORIENTATION=+
MPSVTAPGSAAAREAAVPRVVAPAASWGASKTGMRDASAMSRASMGGVWLARAFLERVGASPGAHAEAAHSQDESLEAAQVVLNVQLVQQV